MQSDRLRRPKRSAAQEALWAIPHRPAWTADGAYFCTGMSCACLAVRPHTNWPASLVSPALHFLDFSAGNEEATFHVAREACAPPCPLAWGCRRCRSEPLAVVTSAPATAVAVHPVTDDMVAGAPGGLLLTVACSRVENIGIYEI